MSTAQEIIEDAYKRIGRGSELFDTDSTFLDDGLNVLRTVMETLRKQDIILEETVSDVTTTIALPSALTDELSEPVAARDHLVNYLAVSLIPTARYEINAAGVPIPSLTQTRYELSKMYLQHTPPTKTPSTLLPRGQGSRYGYNESAFFEGEALDRDAD